MNFDAIGQRYGKRPSEIAQVGYNCAVSYLFDLFVASIASREETKKR